jgi:filamentous hemagglutinin family protein
MTIFQNQSQAIIDWQSFNIGTNASVYFNQQGHTSWVALNRIWDNSPTQIFGRLTADGQVYLINQNGILFAPGAQVNVHALVASSLNLSIDNFLASTLTGGTQQIPLTFNTQQGTMSAKDTNNNYIITDAELQGTIYANRVDTFYNQSNLPGTASNPGVISNAGAIQTDTNGSVFLIGPTVENSGTIVTPSGQIGLIAGTNLELESPETSTGTELYPGGEGRTALMVAINNSPNGYTATNLAGGLLAADTGLVGMYGNIVNQNGIIRSVAAVQNGGHVELFASDLISTGPGSVTAAPVSSSPDLVDPSFPTEQSSITLSGLDPNNPALPQTSTNLIVHEGAIISPSGLVTMNAVDRVYLAPGSLIDVSGLWVYESADALTLKVQMNSSNLTNYYVQQGGFLQGQNVTISIAAGSTLGDVSNAISAIDTTAAQRHTTGGVIDITSAGDIVVRQGALIDFSGGGTVYAAGAIDTTMLVSAGKVYNIATASADVVYESILNDQTFTNSRFGTTKEYNGVYYGGASPVNAYSQSYTVGSNAGTLWLQAPTVVLDGIILGIATNGIQQVLAANPTNLSGNESAYGYTEAQGGTLEIGIGPSGSGTSTGAANFLLQSITVSGQTIPVLPAAFEPTDPLPSTNTVLPAPTLTNAGLSALYLSANTTITVQAGAQITLNPGGTFQAVARRIENYGGITAPGGTINLLLQTDQTSDPGSSNYIPLDERIYLGPGSSLSAAGERIDDTGAAVFSGITTSGYIAGGSISIQDQTVNGDGVIISPGAVVDVSGGYQISPKGKVTGGNAGSLNLQGYALVVDGDLRAQSLLGNNGGSITMTAGNVDVGAAPATLPAGFNAASALPANLVGKLVLGSGQLDGTGFTSITLESINDVVLENGVTLAPSLVKLAAPALGGGASSTAAASAGTVTVTPDLVGVSAITLDAAATATIMAGTTNQYGLMNPQTPNPLARVAISPGAGITVGPGGSITLSGPYIDISGSLDAPAGTIAATATTALSLAQGAVVRAEGYNEAGTVSQLKGAAPDPIPKPGGTITLTSAGDLTLSPGSLVSVDGSSPVGQTVINADGTVTSVTTAGSPGTISLAASGNLSLGGDLEGRAMMAGLPGGTLSIANTNPAGTLALSIGDLAGFQKAGFDALTLASGYQLSLTGSGQAFFGRKLTLDALVIAGSGTDQILLSAPWVQVQAEAANKDANGSLTLPSTSVLAQGNASITLTGEFVDATGSVLFSGFTSVSLAAVDDIRLSDYQYGTSWSGLLAVSGDLTLQAARIYPTTQSIFSVSANGKVTILPSSAQVSGPIFSAGGSLTIESLGSGIDQEGYVAAPMGTISLSAPNGRVYLGSASTTTTQGDAAVAYGSIQSGGSSGGLGVDAWAITGHVGTNTLPTLLQGVPAESITLAGSEVIVRDGATINVSGGGSVFASLFLPSYSGTNNPLTGSYVVVPGNSVVLPGSAVYLTGTKGMPAGTYSLLPALDANGNPTSYVYMPGAMIVTDLGATIASSFKQALTADGYPIVAGYATTMGTGIQSALYEAYEVRPAAVVLAQGEFDVQSFTAGNGGTVSITGKTTTGAASTVILNGTIRASALPGYSGGSIALSGNTVTVQDSTMPLPSGFSFDTPVPADLTGTLDIAAPSLSNQGFQTIGLGVSDLTGSAASVAAYSVDIKPGVTLQAENIILGATNSINLEPGVQVLALALPGDTGQATFISPGTLSIAANAVVHASDAVNLLVGSLSLDPTATLKADHSSLNLQGATITITGSQAVSSSGSSGLFLTVVQWDSLAGSFDDIGLITSVPSSPQSGTVVFNGLSGTDYLAAVKDTLTIDTGLVTTRVNGSDTDSTVTVAAQNIVLENTSGASSLVSASRGASQITFQAQEMEVGKGNILFDGFSTVNMNVANDLTFRGAGEVPQGATFRAAGVLATGGADLNIAASRVTASYYMQSAGTDPSTGAALPPVYTAADFKVDAGAGAVNITAGTGTAGTTTAPDGTLEIDGSAIDVSTLIEIPSGQITLNASGNITLGSGGQLLARGTAYAPGGVVSLTSTGGGAINLLSGSLIDVSAGSQGDAGSISLYAPAGVALNGTIVGYANGGKGGSFSIVTSSLDTVCGDNLFSDLNSKLAYGGFTETLNLEAATGNITIASEETVQAGNVTITADAGSIDLSGIVNVSGLTGGTAQLYAMNNLTVESTGVINASGTNGSGGNVTLGTSTGVLSLVGGTINVSGSGTGGTVTFQALPTDMSLSGTVKGASSVVAEIDEVYVNQFQGTDATGGVSTVINAAAIAQIQSDLTNLMSTNSGLSTQLANGLTDGNGNALTPYDALLNPAGIFHLQPGAVIEQTTGDGDITLASGWNLTSWRYGSSNTEPGTLSLRAAGNLNINANIVDDPTAIDSLTSNTAQPSWNINLVAGANTASANPMAVIPANVAGATAGNLTIASNEVVYTEKGSIGFASGGDTVINNPEYSPIGPYNLATYAGLIRGDVRGNLTLNGGVIESATNDVDIDIGGDLTLGWNSSNSSLGAIWTTGEAASGAALTAYSTYSNGGSISLDVGGDVDGQVVPSIVWLTETTTTTGSRGNRKTTYTLVPNYSSPQGILAMAGGSVSVRAGGNFEAQAGTFGEGDLTIYAGGDLEGRFLVKDGTGTLSAMGNFGMPKQMVNGSLKSWTQLIEMYNAQISVTAQGNVELGAVVNPDLAATVATGNWDNSYTPSASVSLTAVTGDVNMYGSIDARYGILYGPTTSASPFLPASVEIAAGGNINVMAGFTQLPAANGNLSMTAGGDIVFASNVSWLMSDADPSLVYTFGTTTVPGLLESHASTPVHTGDEVPVTISAGGDIEDMNITLPKEAAIFAGRDITDLNFVGQNVSSKDVTSITALGNISYGYAANVDFSEIELSGPGYLVVQAGGSIDLGQSEGIQAVGNYLNPVLLSSGSIVVAAGISGALDQQGVSSFFDGLRRAGEDYSPLLTSDPVAAQGIIDQARTGIITPFLASHGANAGGDIIMTSSQISTAGGGSISVLATGSVDVGTSILQSGQSISFGGVLKNFGIFTSTGGAINVFATGDVNVNEARIMTFEGGDITIWSDTGNVYAGRGDKATVNAGVPKYTCKNDVCSLTFTPPTVGSGIRAVTYAPDENTPAPPIGNIYIFTPSGFVDAGEAGISGGNVILGAMNGVLNAANISFTGQAIGLPPASQGVSLGALTGTSDLSKSIISSDTGALATAQERVASAQPIEDIVMRWVDVNVIDVDWSRGVVGGEDEGGQPEDRRDKKR